MRVAIVGAGGLGSLLGAALHDAGRDVHLVARGEHLAAMKANGLQIIDTGSTRTLHIPCSNELGADARFDLAFVTTKAYSLVGVAPLVRTLVSTGALVVPLVNGVEAVEDLAAAGVDPAGLAPGVAYMTAFRVAPGVVERHGGHARMVFGAPASEAAVARPLMTEVFRDTGVTVDLIADVRVELWKKMAVVCALVAACVEVNGSMGLARASASGRELQEQAVAEVLAVGAARGVTLDLAVERSAHAVLDGFPDDFYPSLIHDLRQGQRTEVAALNGAIGRLGAGVGVPTPRNSKAAMTIRSMEGDRSAAR